jgi:predicted RNA binding protein YcfA (HicA-like mRNA interferase family)
MPKPKRLSGRQVIRILEGFGFNQVSQKGSHVKLKRIIEGKSQTLTVPDHKELDTGTIRAIFHQASQFINPEALKKEMYSE